MADDAAVLARCAALAEVDDPSALPLWGIPFGVKDSIDIAGWPTTLACPGLRLRRDRDGSGGPATARRRGGADRQDQPRPVRHRSERHPHARTRRPHSVYGQDLISGGSSSGSALAVALGEVPFTVATDTAGSGRVPPALNGILGYKPSRGLISAVGLVPACRSLDCISLIAGTVADLEIVLRRGRGAPIDAIRGAGPRSAGDETAADLVVGLPRVRRPRVLRRRRDGRGPPRRPRAAERAAGHPVRRPGPVPGRGRAALPGSVGGRALCRVRRLPAGASRRDALPVVADIINGGARFSAARRVPGAVPTGRAQGRGRPTLRGGRRRRRCRRSAPPSRSRRCWRRRSRPTPPSATTPTAATCSICVPPPCPPALTADGRPVSCMVLGPALADDLVLTAAAALADLFTHSFGVTLPHPAKENR